MKVNLDKGGAEFDGVRIFVRRGSGFVLTENRGMREKVKELEYLLGNAERERGLSVVNTDHEPINIRGLTDEENRELNGMLTPVLPFCVAPE